MPAGDVAVLTTGQLDGRTAGQARELVRLAAEEDHASPVSEHVLLQLKYGATAGTSGGRSLLRYAGQVLAGFAQLDPADPAEPAGARSAELVVSPAYRRRGHGMALSRALSAAAGDRPLRVWAHGDLPAAARLAAAAGFQRTRALWQMRGSLAEPAAEPLFPAGVRLRTFVVGADEEAWTELNSRAFSKHPEQGSWTRGDLELREREPWFDPAGFFLAERNGRLVGFHWTKVHHAEVTRRTDHTRRAPDSADRQGEDSGGEEPGSGPREPIGEVYVVGVDPGERGTGLGRALTQAGLGYLRSRGLPRVLLYVDADNTPAVRLYESLGLARWSTDVMYSRIPPARPV